MLNVFTKTYNLIPHCFFKEGKEVDISEGRYNKMGQEKFLYKNKAKNGQY